MSEVDQKKMPFALNSEVLEQARTHAKQNGVTVFDAVQAISLETPRTVSIAIARLLGVRDMHTAHMFECTPAFDLLSLNKAMQNQCVILRQTDGQLLAVVPDLFDADLQTWISTRTQLRLEFCLALKSDIQAYLSKMEETAKTTDDFKSNREVIKSDTKSSNVLSFSSISDATSPAVKLVNATLYDALKLGASDIHLESTASGLSVKYRIDGVLDFITSTNSVDEAERVISRLKVLAELDIAERRIPQDGSFCVEVNQREIDLRLSIMPSVHGEDAVIRILDKRAMVEAHGALNLDALGFDSASLQTLRKLTEEAYGMLLVTGPTGSGKTTTLYGALTEINTGREKIITIEDPVEYQLQGVLQIPVNEKKGLTFARGLRSILRHDPDKIMVGEIRDQETAEIAVQSALTGHLVLTTVHANNVFDVFGRFAHMGIDPYAFVSALNGIWAQRLVRLNCLQCAIEMKPSVQELESVGLKNQDVSEYQFKRGQGCGDCRGTGYKGRRAIAEILSLNDELRELIIEKRPLRQIKEAAKRNGTISLREAALGLVKKGETTIEEIKRITLHA